MLPLQRPVRAGLFISAGFASSAPAAAPDFRKRHSRLLVGRNVSTAMSVKAEWRFDVRTG
jgi:hypothetical protein